VNAINTFFASIGLLGLLAAIVLWVAVVWGWVLNIISLIGMIGGDFNVLLVLRVVGIFFAPLGAALGWWA
jgi:hypothetical protein